jgi:hypothetical protein
MPQDLCAAGSSGGKFDLQIFQDFVAQGVVFVFGNNTLFEDGFEFF